MLLIFMNLLPYRFIGSTHLFGTLEYLCRYGNPFWLLKRNKKNWTPISNSYAGSAYIFTMESIYYIIILLNDAVLLYSKFCLLCLLVIIVSRRKNKQQYISLLRTKWKFDIKYLLSNYQSTTWLFITTF